MYPADYMLTGRSRSFDSGHRGWNAEYVARADRKRSRGICIEVYRSALHLAEEVPLQEPYQSLDRSHNCSTKKRPKQDSRSIRVAGVAALDASAMWKQMTWMTPVLCVCMQSICRHEGLKHKVSYRDYSETGCTRRYRWLAEVHRAVTGVATEASNERRGQMVSQYNRLAP
jgi:hypothetical protein